MSLMENRSQEILSMGAAQAVAAMRSGDITAEAYASTLLGRAEKCTRFNIFCSLEKDKLLDAAHELDKKRAAGHKLGQLHGLPIPIKDSINTKQFPTTNGTAALRSFFPKEDAAIVRTVCEHGAILMGKTNMDELSFGWSGENEVFGNVINPYNEDYWPGGSSAGSAVAVATGCAPLAIGEDTVGSIRCPASMCGVAGFRPSFGRYPNAGLLSLTEGKFDQIGVFSRNIEDMILWDCVITSSPVPDRLVQFDSFRVGVSPAFFFESLDVELEGICQEALYRLSEAGFKVTWADVPETLRGALDVARQIVQYEAASNLGLFLARQCPEISLNEVLASLGKKTKFLFTELLLPPNRVSENSYREALIACDNIRRETIRYFNESNIFVMAFPAVLSALRQHPCASQPAIASNGLSLEASMARNVALGTCAGMASIVIPIGVTKNNIPIGIEFLAMDGADQMLLSFARELEKIFGKIPGPEI